MPIKNKKPQIPNDDTPAPVINQTQTTKLNSEQSQPKPESALSAESKTDSATPQPVIQSQPEASTQSSETSIKNKQADDNFSKRYKTLQNSLIDNVNSIRKTYPNRRDWAGDFMINSMKDVLETDFIANLNHSGNADLDINRYALALEIQKIKSQLLELCWEHLKKNGIDELLIRNQYNQYKILRQ
jgi:hypothetical protein